MYVDAKALVWFFFVPPGAIPDVRTVIGTHVRRRSAASQEAKNIAHQREQVSQHERRKAGELRRRGSMTTTHTLIHKSEL